MFLLAYLEGPNREGSCLPELQMAEENENKRERSWSSDGAVFGLSAQASDEPRAAAAPRARRHRAAVRHTSLPYIRLIVLSSLDECPAVVFG